MLLSFVLMINGLNVMQYHAPVVTIRDGNGWVINGYFNLVHVVNLKSYQEALDKLMSWSLDGTGQTGKDIVELYHDRIAENLYLLSGAKPTTKAKRSINWIGSAWKWLAGSPDAIDWSDIVRNEADIVEQNNNQYKVNERVFGSIDELIAQINDVSSALNEVSRVSSADQVNQAVLNKLHVVKDEIGEVVRACQMAKNGIVNSNLLDHDEIHRLVAEMETLPYANLVQAVEYGKPTVYTNGTMLLYVLSMPKVMKTAYHVLIARASIQDGKQLDLPFSRVLVTQTETLGLVGECLTISNSTICEEHSIVQVPEEDCIAKAIKGGSASCTHATTSKEVVEMITEDTIFVTNFHGILKNGVSSRNLSGTYVIQLNNETIMLNGRTYSSTSVTRLQALPSAVTNITVGDLKVNLDLVHNIGRENIRWLQMLQKGVFMSSGTNLAFMGLVGLAVLLAWRKLTQTAGMPTVECVTQAATGPMRMPFHNVDLRDADN